MRQLQELKTADYPDIDLFLQVIELVRSHPAGTTSELMGRLYGTPLGSRLTQLLPREQITPEAGRAKEFSELLHRLLQSHQHKKTRQSRLEEALEKARQKLLMKHQAVK